MKNVFKELIDNESGLVLSAELVLILTICVLGIVVGLVQVQTAVISEFQDLGLAFSSMNQSFSTPGFMGCRKWWGGTSWTAGSGFIDVFNGCVGMNGWNGAGGWGGGMGGGYAEIGGGYSGGYYSAAPSTGSTVITPQVAPCDTCTPGTTTTTPVPDCAPPAQPPSTIPDTVIPSHPSPLPPPPIPTKDH